MKLKDYCLTAAAALGLAAVSLVGAPALAVADEIPSLVERVKAGELPPLSERLPETPHVTTLDGSDLKPGEYGGELRLLMGKSRDIRMMSVYGYARLVRYNKELEIEPDILERIDVEDDRVFTMHLRKGHKWSDGHPFTAEDFRYYWEDVANNETLSPFGPERELFVDDEPPKVEFLDEHTLRYSWSKPNPYFLVTLAGALPLYIYRPAHYLKQFHAKYTDEAKLAELVDESGSRNWAGLHHRYDKLYRFDNPDLPVLQPWLNTTAMPSERFVFVRNPFFHRVDQLGRQLPYIDTVVLNIASSSLVPAKTGSGESDLQARYLRLDNFPFLKDGAERNDYEVRLWRHVSGSQTALYPNLNSADPVWRALARDPRLRRALSLAVDRKEINQVIYFGSVIESNNTVLPESPLFKPKYQKNFAEFDLAKANALLDEIGLTERDDRGVRLMSDGRPLEIVVQTAGESTEESDILELVHDSWLKAGIKLYTKPSQREVFRNRVYAGEAMMSVWKGVENGIPNANMSPREFAPTSQEQLQWPKWGQFFETKGQTGEAPDIPEGQRLAELNAAWREASTREQKETIWHEILDLHAEQIFSIGIVSGARQPVVVNKNLNNVPKEGIYNWEPGAYFGIYRPDTFWFSEPRRSSSG